jgi:hypothetical protein
MKDHVHNSDAPVRMLLQKGVAKVHIMKDEIESVRQQLMEKDVTIEELKSDLVSHRSRCLDVVCLLKIDVIPCVTACMSITFCVNCTQEIKSLYVCVRAWTCAQMRAGLSVCVCVCVYIYIYIYIYSCIDMRTNMCIRLDIQNDRA